ncbi:MAG: cobalamin-dependent protein [Eubacteriales bacterium]
MLMNRIIDFKQALYSINRLEAEKILAQCVEEAENTMEVIEGLVVRTLDEIGSEWEEGRVSLSQVYMSGVICEELVDQLLLPQSQKRKNQPRMAIAVLEDHHLLGKRIVCSVVRASGYELIDYGHGLMVDDIVERVVRDKIQIMLISTLMLSSALKVKDLKKKLNDLGAPTKVIVGGAPFRLDYQLCKDVDADGAAVTAAETIGVIKKVVDSIG